MATHTSTPNQSLDDGGFIAPSELILVRIPVAEGDPLLQTSTTVATGIPQLSQPQRQHHAFVRATTLHPIGSILEVYPIVSFKREVGAVDGYNAASESVKRRLIPLPPLSSTFPTPPLFGPQLFIGGWINSRDAFLSVYPITFELSSSAKFKKFTPQVVLSHSELARIDSYRNQLPANTSLDQGGLSGSGPGAILCCRGGEQNRTANEAQDDNATDIFPEDESTDEDCSPTIKDDLILLAHSHPSWIPELEKYIEAERAEVHAECTLRVESWLQSLQ